MLRWIVCIAAVYGLALTVMGAVGAHLLAGDAAAGARWSTAMLYGYAHTLAAHATAIGGAAAPGVLGRTWCGFAGTAFLIGVALFTGVQLLRLAAGSAASSGVLAMMGPLVPVGGLALMAGWVFFAIAAWRRPASSP